MVVPLVEIFVLIQVGQVIGPWWTILLLIADSILGTWLIRREGGRAWAALRSALNSGQMPAKELADGALILIGGTLMLSPGFVTDLLGIAADPAVHAPARPSGAHRGGHPPSDGRRRGGVHAATGARGSAPGNQQRPHPNPDGSVVEGEVVD